jgi:hypothetical protein
VEKALLPTTFAPSKSAAYKYPLHSGIVAFL